MNLNITLCNKKHIKPFTLLELLVVVAIIGILVSILLPSLLKAKESAKNAVCLSNMKQTFLAFTVYGKNNSGNLVPNQAHSYGSGHGILSAKTGNLWFGQGHLIKQNYLKESDARLFYCPSSKHEFIKYGVQKNGKGGWPTSEQAMLNYIWTSYVYRGSFDSPYRPANLSKDDSNSALYTEHFSMHVSQGNMSQYNGHSHNNVTYLDGSAQGERGRYQSIFNAQPDFLNYYQQEVVWANYLDRE